MSFLLDTNVVSEARRPPGDTVVKAWLASVPADSLYLSVLVVGEIRRGVERLRRRDAPQAAIYEAWLATLDLDYADHIIPITADIAEEWGRLGVPDPIPTADGLMAATARVHGLTLVTRNTADFVRTGVPLVNPFELGS
jgi:predicted nucleic acid-binding protein